MSDIRVIVFKRSGRPFFEAQWIDPITGRAKTRSTKETSRREADKWAGALQHRLNTNASIDPNRTTWEELAKRYESEALASRAKKTRYKFTAARKWVGRIIDPKYARALTTSELSKFQTALRHEGLAESTIKGHLSALRACLNWGFRMGLFPIIPVIEMPKRVNRMKGRPITDTEFQAMLDKTAAEVGPENAAGFQFFMHGLWLSGLRLDEGMRLNWQPTFDGISVHITNGKVRLKIEANEDKSTKPRLLPITDDFAAFLLDVPEADRFGYVFDPRVIGQETERLRSDTCSKVITRIGEAAEIVVAENRPRPGETVIRKKFASAQDFRRSFGTRWAPHVPPAYLQELMRHASLQTTMQFYVVNDLHAIENAVSEAMQKVTNTSANILPFRRLA